MTTGIHHVTGLTRDVQANVDFYAGFLGLRLVKRTAGFEDAEQLHLFYGDQQGSPGSIISFLVWQDGGSGRTGLGQVAELAFAVPPAAIGNWLTKALSARIPVEGPKRELGETVLRLKDPDGIIVKLVGIDLPATAPLPDPDAPTRIRSVTILTAEAGSAIEMLTRFGYRSGVVDGAITRMVSDRDVVDVRQVAGYAPGIAGAGTIDHLALRAPDAAAVKTMRDALPTHLGLVNMHDRKYFTSLYVRDAGEVLYEYASDGPGFAVDEADAHLGETLFTPPGDAERAQDLAVMLPQFALPGESGWPRRQLLFTHRHFEPEAASDRVIITLHGTDGNETSLLPLAHRADPTARLIGLRGRATDDGHLRWFRSFGYEDYDQADIRAEAEAFAAFLPELAQLHDFDLSQAVFLGHSNGANFLAAVMRLVPGLIPRAALLRAQDVLQEDPAPAAISGDVLVLAGERDLLVGHRGKALAERLAQLGANSRLVEIAATHELAPADAAALAAWF